MGEVMSTVPPYLQPKLEVTLANPECLPVRAFESDAGADLKSTTSHILYPEYTRMYDTGVAIKIPIGFVGLVFSRSGQGKIGVSLPNSVGVIDSSYRGTIRVMLHNSGDNPYEIKAFETKIAQLVIVPIVLAQFKVVDKLDDTERGTSGFGSTG